MLRIVLRLLVALALIAQGGVAAAAPLASGPGGHHCGAAMHHDQHAPKCPCCPAKSLDMHCGDTCTIFAALPALHLQIDPRLVAIPQRLEPIAIVAAAIETPLRPPIA